MTKQPQSIAIIGGGSWATALVWLLTGNGHKVRWWVRSPTDRQILAAEGHNPRYLKGVVLPTARLQMAASLEEALQADAILLVVPSAFVAESLAGVKPEQLAGKQVASAIKGLVPGSGQRVAAYMHSTYQVPASHYTVITGPSHAEEVVSGQLTFLTCGSSLEASAQFWANALQGPKLHTVLSDDVEGLEYGGVMKNLYALAVGLAVGLGYGDNFRSVLASACIRELEDYLAAEHPNPRRHVTDSAYLGDLLVTAYSAHSRNRRLGQLVGEGLTTQQALAEMNMVAEGYYAARVLFESAVPHTGLPIAHYVYKVLHQNLLPGPALQTLSANFR